MRSEASWTICVKCPHSLLQKSSPFNSCVLIEIGVGLLRIPGAVESFDDRHIGAFVLVEPIVGLRIDDALRLLESDADSIDARSGDVLSGSREHV